MTAYNEKFMKVALKEAKKAFELKEVPIGAVIVYNNEIIGSGHNRKENKNDPTAHAEIIAIKEAANHLSDWRLNDCQLYVTIEPCPMCAGAILQSRIEKLIYGAEDIKAGAAGSLYNLLEDERFNHQVQIFRGVMSKNCQNLMQSFFQKLRTENKS